MNQALAQIMIPFGSKITRIDAKRAHLEMIDYMMLHWKYDDYTCTKCIWKRYEKKLLRGKKMRGYATPNCCLSITWKTNKKQTEQFLFLEIDQGEARSVQGETDALEDFLKKYGKNQKDPGRADQLVSEGGCHDQLRESGDPQRVVPPGQIRLFGFATYVQSFLLSLVVKLVVT